MFRCEFCGQVYSREAAFIKHECEPMKRARIFETSTGQSAFFLYQKWWSLRRRIPPNADKFKESSQFKPMVNFAKFVKQTKLNVDVYLEMVIGLQLPPEHWLRDDVYVRYLEYIDKTVSSADQIKMCVDFLLKMSDAIDCDTSEVFNHVLPTEVMQFVRDRKLSPWILLHSKQFKTWLIAQDGDVQVRLQDLIRPVYWKMRFEKEPGTVESAKQVTRALGL